MQATLENIKQDLTKNVYKNEEHIRLSLVCRILDKLGWDVWNPEEVYPEFVPNQREDSTRVDLALFIGDRKPYVFIETKAPGKIDGRMLEAVEKQVRDYNRNNNALFSIITDGQKWRFYYALSRGEFADKCFREFDFLQDETSTIEEILTGFLTKESLQTGAEDAAKKYLRLSQKEKAMQKCLPETTGLMNKPPYYTKPQALVELMKRQGITLTEEQAMEFLEKNPSLPNPNRESFGSVSTSPRAKKTYYPQPVRQGRFTFTKASGYVGDTFGKNWKELHKIAIGKALDKGYNVDHLNETLKAGLKEGQHTENGYKSLPGNQVSYQGRDAQTIFEDLGKLATLINQPIRLEVKFGAKSIEPGKTEKYEIKP